MSKEKLNPKDENLQTVESALTRSEKFIEENQNLLLIIIAAIFGVVLLVLAFNRFYMGPREKEAQAQMFVAEQYFARDSFKLALNGDGQYLGFIDIIDEYSMTKAADLAHYYAGISYLHLGQFEDAIDYLKGFDSDSHILQPVAYGAIGDAYSELGNNEKAAVYYTKAYKEDKNNLTAPVYMVKAGKTYENLKDYKNALKAFESLKEQFPKTQEGRNAEKYIARIKAKAGME